MIICSGCWPWNLPLQYPAHKLGNGGSTPMTYEQNFLYHWHVVLHQRNQDGTPNWAGEFDLSPKQTLDFSQKDCNV